MRNYLMGFAAIVLAIGFSAFTAKKALTADKYFIHVSGSQKNIVNYIQSPIKPNPCNGTSFTCWFLVRDLDGNNVISVAEFETAFELLDGDLGGSDNDNLNDEDEIDSPETDQVHEKHD